MFSMNPEKWKKITPIWFEWLRWFLALGAVGFVAEKTQVLGLQIIYGISYVVFMMLITTTISDIISLNIIKIQKINKIFTLILSIGLLAVTYIILNQSIKALLKG
jgi:hypothetical protein